MNGFWVFMLVMVLLVPLTMMLFGYLFYFKPPKNINRIYGYRTKRSMKNSRTWEFAHEYCGWLWMRFGAVMFALSLACMNHLARGKDIDTMGFCGGILVTIQCILLVLTIPLTEKALRKNFDEYGMKKEQ